jgi:dihydrofolate reductase
MMAFRHPGEGSSVPRLIYYVASSLDGYIADENGSVDWLPEDQPGVDYGYGEFIDSVDALLMGRRTYDQVMDFGVEWPYSGKPVRVWTRRLLEDAPDLVEPVAGAPRPVLDQLAAEGFANVWLVGGAELAEALRSEGLIDEWIVTLIPRAIGGGVPLFGGVQEDLEITGYEQFPGSILQLRMRKRD